MTLIFDLHATEKLPFFSSFLPHMDIFPVTRRSAAAVIAKHIVETRNFFTASYRHHSTFIRTNCVLKNSDGVISSSTGALKHAAYEQESPAVAKKPTRRESMPCVPFHFTELHFAEFQIDDA